MGAVLKGRDLDLGREVALKVLREDYRDDATMIRRFVEAAQIGGQLEHPGVVPMYELGTMARSGALQARGVRHVCASDVRFAIVVEIVEHRKSQGPRNANSRSNGTETG